MRRSVTDTAQMSTGGPLDPSLYYQAPTIPEMNDEDEEDNDDGALPPSMELTRLTTTENFESAYEWSWAFDQDARHPSGPPMQQPQQPDMQQGMVMMPMQPGMPMQPTMMVMMPMMQQQKQQNPQQGGGYGGVPQKAVEEHPEAQQMPMRMRGVRWPNEMAGGPPEQESKPQVAMVQPAPAKEAPKSQLSKYSASDEPPALEPLTRAFSVNSGAFRINWTLSAFKLQSGDRSVVSPPFELSFGGQYSATNFKLMLFPQVSSEGKGGSTFRKSKGKGFILLKCEADIREVATLKFRLFVGSQAPRGPVTHDFSQSAVKGLPKELETWDLDPSVTNGHFVVGAEIIPLAGPQW